MKCHKYLYLGYDDKNALVARSNKKKAIEKTRIYKDSRVVKYVCDGPVWGVDCSNNPGFKCPKRKG